MNFQICGRRTDLTTIQLTTETGVIIQQRVQQTMVQDVNDLMRRLTDVWAGVEESVIQDVNITSGACMRSTPTFEPQDIMNIC